MGTNRQANPQRLRTLGIALDLVKVLERPDDPWETDEDLGD